MSQCTTNDSELMQDIVIQCKLVFHKPYQYVATPI